MVVAGWSAVTIREPWNRQLIRVRNLELWGAWFGDRFAGRSKIESRDRKVGKVTVFAKQNIEQM